LGKEVVQQLQKPTGKSGDITGRIYRCLAIECQIQCNASELILGASSGESLNENDQGSKESDDFSYGGSGVYDDEVPAANAPRNDDAHEPVDADSDEELLDKVADVAHSPSFPNFIGGRPNVVTTVARSRGAGQGGRGDG
jgi:hypothetical protein